MSTEQSHSRHWLLGDMEPINKTLRDSTPDRRQVSFRWLSGSVLAGLTSLFLMGGALFAAFDGRQQLSIQASSVKGTNNSTRTGQNDEAQKGDRVGFNQQIAKENTNIMMVPTISRINDRDVVKVRPFMVLQAPLAVAPLRKVEYPKFNPLTVFSVSGKQEIIAKSNDSIYGAEVESEVSIKVSDFPYEDAKLLLSTPRQDSDAAEMIRQAENNIQNGTPIIASLPQIDPTRFSKNENETFISSGVVITAENVSIRSKINPEDFPGKRYEDRIIRIRAESTLKEILEAEGLDAQEAEHIEKSLSADLGDQKLGRDDRIRLAYQVTQDEISVSRISVYRGTGHLVSIARDETEKFIYSQEPARPPQLTSGIKRHNTVASSRLPSAYDGINRAARSEGLSEDLTKMLVRIFAFDVDFRKKIAPSDELKVFVSLEDGEKTPTADSEILFASIKLGNLTRRYYRFRDAETGTIDYYDERGKSAKKFLLRKPVPNGKYRSGFGFRRHPISKARKMHWGADWSAPRGTPIIAAGNGVVLKAGWSGGYGKQTIIQHANGYKTSYSHQTAYAKGIKAGKRVRQGQIIGFVGSTGYSTGPHLHYEVIVNGNKVNPMRIRLPKGKILKGEELLAFEAERDRIDGLINKQDYDSPRLALN